jgi:putative ABC transport system substrate-binding protein
VGGRPRLLDRISPRRQPARAAAAARSRAGGPDRHPRPGGNVTGIAFLAQKLAAKRLQLLKLALPDLPVEQPTEFELALNARTAKAIERVLPPSSSLRADAVIEGVNPPAPPPCAAARR